MPLADIYVPENALEYVIQVNLKKNRLANSGSMGPSLMPVGAGIVNVQPFWGDLSGEFADNVEGGTLNFAGIESASSVAPILNLEKGWKQDGIVDAVATGDKTVITSMVTRVGNFSSREVNRIGLKAAVAGTVGVHDPATGYATVIDLTAVTAGQVAPGISFAALQRGRGLFGDQVEIVQTIWMHSDAKAHLDELNFISMKEGRSADYAPFGYIGNDIVMVDNALTPEVVTGSAGDVLIYPFMFGAASFSSYGDGSVARKVAFTKYDDDLDADKLSTRQRASIHTWGCNYIPTSQTVPATIAEVIDSANYESAFDGVDMGGYPFRTSLVLASLEDFTTV